MKPTKPRGGKIDFTIPEMFPLIENGSKYVTIRKHRKNDLEVGGTLKVYLGNRFHGGQRYLGTAEILALEDMFLDNSEVMSFVDIAEGKQLFRVFVSGKGEMSESELMQLSIIDGFESINDFLVYHAKDFVTKQIITFGNQSWLH